MCVCVCVCVCVCTCACVCACKGMMEQGEQRFPTFNLQLVKETAVENAVIIALNGHIVDLSLCL